MGILDAHNVYVVASGELHVVLAHGFGTDQSVSKCLVSHLLDEHRIVLFNNMGAGPTNPDYYDFERCSTLEGPAFDLLAILEREIQERAYLGDPNVCLSSFCCRSTIVGCLTGCCICGCLSSGCTIS